MDTIHAVLVLGLGILLTLTYPAHAGPDLNRVSNECKVKLRSIPRDRRNEERTATQFILRLQAELGLTRLGRGEHQINQLEAWLATNQSAIADLGSALQCFTNRRSVASYHGRPLFSILLEYFKRPWSIRRMADTLRQACQDSGLPCELVVNVDNPQEAGEWAAVAQETGGFVVPVFSANVHEARGYNRAARAARGQYLIIWQDDQIAPSGSLWLRDLQRLFEAWPRLAILGMNTYRLCKDREPTNRFFVTAWEPDPRTGLRWTFAQYVDFAPLVVRAQAFAAMGGLDEGISRRGDCGIWGDWELCNRAWLEGWQVGYMHLPGRSDDGHEGGTHTFANAEKCWGRQQMVAATSFHKRYGVDAWTEELCDKVWRLNMQAFTLSDPAACPYGIEATRYANCTKPQR